MIGPDGRLAGEKRPNNMLAESRLAEARAEHTTQRMDLPAANFLPF